MNGRNLENEPALSRDQIDQIARCMRNSAVMLEIADSEHATDEKRRRFRELNQSQAALLRKAAQMLEDYNETA